MILARNMVGETTINQVQLKDVLTEKQVCQIVREYVSGDHWQLIDAKVYPATEGISGFLGDHLKATLTVKVDDWVQEIRIFIKCMPLNNKPKAEFIEKSNFYRRERIMFQLFKQFQEVEGKVL
jgi:hypothetical protein